MTRPRPPKKTETLEIRLPPATKRAFMDRCRDEGLTASDAVRGFIETRTAPAGRHARLWQAAVAAAVGLAVGAVAGPSLAQSGTPDRAAFERMDRNHDGVLTLQEFRR